MLLECERKVRPQYKLNDSHPLPVRNLSNSKNIVKFIEYFVFFFVQEMLKSTENISRRFLTSPNFSSIS